MIKSLEEIVNNFNINDDEYIAYGKNMAKLDYNILKRLKDEKDGKLILVTAINPTKAGEGKTTVSIGLADGLNKIGRKTILALREPSLGPYFGIKGGATGGGLSTLEPNLNINLHFNGDFHAITSAHNLLSSLIDTHIFFKNELRFKKVLWPRALDVNDRNLRTIKTNSREDDFVITAASELMAILALSKSLTDLRSRINNIIIGLNDFNKPIFVSDMKCANALVLLLKDAIHPNIVRSSENTLALVHTGPFANIAHGCNSILATNCALKLADYVVTEAGFGSDLGFEKFLDIKMQHLTSDVSLVVLVATTNSLKAHGGAIDYNKPNMDALVRGLNNLKAHIDIIKSYNLNLVIAINKHKYNNDEELDYLLNWARNNNIPAAISDGFNKGSIGTTNLAKVVINTIDNNNNKLNHPYDLSDDAISKIDKIAKKIYGAKNVKYSKKALGQLDLYKDILKDMPVCIAKTPLSLSGRSKLINRPKDFTLYIDQIKLSNGAGFFVALTKGIYLMPGLNKQSRAYDINIDDLL